MARVSLTMGHNPRPRVHGAERESLGQRLAVEYACGGSIRTLADGYSLSITLTRTLLREQDVTLRSRAGSKRIRSNCART
jgi:hypothetical protein